MSTPRSLGPILPLIGSACVAGFVPGLAWAQHAESRRVLPALDSGAGAATQTGRRLFLGGRFGRVAPDTGTAALFDAAGQVLPGGWPVIGRSIEKIIPDTWGGWIAVGSFAAVDGQPTRAECGRGESSGPERRPRSGTR